MLALFLIYFSVTAGTKLQPEKLELTQNCVRVFDGNGEEIALSKINASLSELPDYLPNAFVAVEDKRFYNHHGLDYKRMGKATMKNAVSFSFREGASTISQQLIKNTHLSGEKTLTRKLKEIKLTRQLEKRYTKKEILELYINSIYFGHSAFGIGSAARFYFGKEARDLTPAESATLAALVKSPNRYSPFKDAEKCLSRRNFVLTLMAEQGYLTSEQAEEAKNEPLPASPAPAEEKSSYLSLVWNELTELFPDVSSGDELYVYTFLDRTLQSELEKTQAESDVCVLVRDNAKNGIKAVYSTCGLLRRLPASAIKPLAVYAPALEENLISPATPVLDEKINYAGYSPANYGGQYGGYMSVRYALSRSVNVPAVKILNELGTERACSYLEKMNLSVAKNDRSLALALGGMKEGFTLSELADGYAVFADGGYYAPSGFIDRVMDGKHQTLYKHSPVKRVVFSEDVCCLVNDMLQTAAKEGTAKKLKSLPFPVCAKTGTGSSSAGNTDAYTIAYTKDDTVAVWLGNRDNSPVEATGGGLPANIALRILQTLYQNCSPATFPTSDQVIEIAFDKEEYETRHRLICADPLAPPYLTSKELFRKSAIPEGKSTRFSCPSIKKPLISVKNDAVVIELCQTQYYDYIVKRQCGDEIKTIYSGKYRQTICDNSVRQGEKYTYTVIPVWQGVEGVPVELPSVLIENRSEIPDRWWED